MATLAWVDVIAMCIAPAAILFLGAGVISIFKHAKARFYTKK